jgi:beta-glucosidase
MLFKRNEETERRINEILSQMTLEEKIGQMRQDGSSIVGTFGVDFAEMLNMMFDGKITHEEFKDAMKNSTRDYHEDDIRAGKLGSLNGVCGAELTNRLQRIAVEESRLGIPLIFGSDIIHGYQTVFPTPLAQSCSWDPKLARDCARTAAVEGSADGVNWTFAPMLDLARDARWGRVTEGVGEDPFLGKAFAKAMVEGYQNGDISREDSLVACPKHFIAYGAAEGGKDYNSVHLSEDTLREQFLPPFQGAVEAGCATMMPAFNDINGIPCSNNRHLLGEVLRGELGFEGYLVSDANAVAECIAHGTAADNAEAGRNAVRAGVDMEMSGPAYATLAQSVADGDLDEKEIDECVRRILRVKFAAGLFDHPYVDESRAKTQILTSETRMAAKSAAERSAVLLKNNGVLPLNRGKRIALVGALADSQEDMLGAWALNGRATDANTVLGELEKKVSLTYCKGADWADFYEPEDVEAAVKDTDVVVAVVGEATTQSGEAASRSDIRLPGKQEELIHQLKALGKTVVCVLINGRPLALQDVVEDCDAILECWQLGTESGSAITALLLGEAAPSGHLSISFPRVTGQCPMYYNHQNTGRPAGRSKFTSKYLDVDEGPLFPFGYGLTYTAFEAEGLTASVENGALTAEWSVKNTGDCSGVYTAQLYVRDPVALKSRPVKELKGFARYELAPGEGTQVRLSVPVKELGFWLNGRYIVEPGVFTVFAGDSSEVALSAEVTVTREQI